MLKIMIMPGKIGLNLVFLEQWKEVLDQLGRVSMLASRVDRMMADHNFPRSG